MVRFIQPDSQESWAAARRLVEEYAASLDVDLGFQDFDRELESLAKEYGPPSGCFLIAESNGDAIACGAIRSFESRTCEMKRLYVVPGHRGTGLGRALVERLIDQARRLGYERIVLDTLPSMGAARRLYESLGFEPVTAYRHNPVDGTAFLALRLTTSDRSGNS